jgi:hypothetical protein
MPIFLEHELGTSIQAVPVASIKLFQVSSKYLIQIGNSVSHTDFKAFNLWIV